MSKQTIFGKVIEQLRSLKKLTHTQQGKEIITFLGFVVLATGIWFILAINDNREDVVQIPIELTNLPEEAVLLQDMPSYVEARIRDKGAALLSYDINGIKPIKIDFVRHSNNKDAITLSNSAIIEYTRRQLSATTAINDIAPDSIRIAYTCEKGRRVPLSISAEITTSPFCTLSDSVYITTDSATLYGKTAQTSRVTRLYTEDIVVQNISDTAYIRARIKSPEGTRVIPDSVTIVIPVEEYTTKTFSVPIVIGGVPQGYTVMTFPSHVTITCNIPMSKYATTVGNDFLIGSTYATIQEAPGAYAAIELLNAPQFVHNITLSTDSVEYVITENTLRAKQHYNDTIQP